MNLMTLKRLETLTLIQCLEIVNCIAVIVAPPLPPQPPRSTAAAFAAARAARKKRCWGRKPRGSGGGCGGGCGTCGAFLKAVSILALDLADVGIINLVLADAGLVALVGPASHTQFAARLLHRCRRNAQRVGSLRERQIGEAIKDLESYFDGLDLCCPTYTTARTSFSLAPRNHCIHTCHSCAYTHMPQTRTAPSEAQRRQPPAPHAPAPHACSCQSMAVQRMPQYSTFSLPGIRSTCYIFKTKNNIVKKAKRVSKLVVKKNISFDD